MADIQEMRPFLVRGFHEVEAMIRIGQGLFVACNWTLRFGLLLLIAEESEAEVLHSLSMHCYDLTATVRRDGILLESSSPWITTEVIADEGHARWLPENVLVMERVHERLYDLYDRIDFDRVPRTCRVRGGQGRARGRCGRPVLPGPGGGRSIRKSWRNPPRRRKVRLAPYRPHVESGGSG